MLYPSINEVKKKTDSRYTLCILTAKRSRDLIDGKPALEETEIERPVSIAAAEIADGLITYKTKEQVEEEAAKAAAAASVEEAEAEAEAGVEKDGWDSPEAETGVAAEAAETAEEEPAGEDE